MVVVILSTLKVKQKVTVRCINLGTEPCEHKAGTAIKIHRPVKDIQIDVANIRAKSLQPGVC